MLFGYSLSVVTNVNKIQHGSAHYRAAYYGMSVYRSVEMGVLGHTKSTFSDAHIWGAKG